MNRHIEKNKEHIKANRQRIEENKDEIKENRKLIIKLYRRIHILEIALVVVLTLLLFTNGVWLYAKNKGLTIITKDGTTNVIGNDGEIRSNGDGE